MGTMVWNWFRRNWGGIVWVLFMAMWIVVLWWFLGRLELCITAVATFAIAWYGLASHELAREIKATRDKHDQETRSIFKALVVSNVLATSRGTVDKDYKEAIAKFFEYFDEECPPKMFGKEDEIRRQYGVK